MISTASRRDLAVVPRSPACTIDFARNGRIIIPPSPPPPPTSEDFFSSLLFSFSFFLFSFFFFLFSLLFFFFLIPDSVPRDARRGTSCNQNKPRVPAVRAVGEREEKGGRRKKNERSRKYRVVRLAVAIDLARARARSLTCAPAAVSRVRRRSYY